MYLSSAYTISSIYFEVQEAVQFKRDSVIPLLNATAAPSFWSSPKSTKRSFSRWTHSATVCLLSWCYFVCL